VTGLELSPLCISVPVCAAAECYRDFKRQKEVHGLHPIEYAYQAMRNLQLGLKTFAHEAAAGIGALTV
jgi:hypothetical protein